LEFIDHGWTPALAEKLLLPRQALHCAKIEILGGANGEGARESRAPLAPEMAAFCRERMGAAVEPWLV
jgi:23S rRNA pseudouridine1911/1915/1917 synthase